MISIGLISDVHSSPAEVAEALSIFEDQGVDSVYCAGDIAGYMDQLDETVQLLVENDCMTVIGNHDLLHIDHHDDEPDTAAIAYLKALPTFIETTLEAKKVYMVHAQPPDGCHGGIKLLDKKGDLIPEKIDYWTKTLGCYDFDVLVVGHTHQVFAEKLGDILVVNPGSSVFNNSCAILSLPDMKVEFFALAGKEIQTTWNWGEHVIYGK